MDAFADVVEKYVPLNKGHITTRQNIQIHHVPLRDAAELIRELGDAGLSSREGCGNTVRNVTGDPWAGVCEGELFDPTPYAGAYVRYFVRHPTTQLMPRKIKTAFTGDRRGPRDHRHPRHRLHPARQRDGVSGLRDARRRRHVDHAAHRARRSTTSSSADDGEYLKIAEAVFRIFDRQDWLRVNRARARIKVLVDKFGIDELRRQVEEELEGDWVAERDFDPSTAALRRRRGGRRARRRRAAYGSPNGDRSEFDRFAASNVDAAAPGRASRPSQVKITRGDLTPEQFRGLAAIMRDFTGGYARTHGATRTSSCAGCATRRVYDVWQRARASSASATPGADEITDVVSCPGTDSLQARHHRARWASTRRVAGAPRGDGDRRPADAQDPHQDERLPERLQPAPHRATSGSTARRSRSASTRSRRTSPTSAATYEGGEVAYGTRLKVRLPAKRVPDAVERWMRLYEAEREDGEAFNDFAERVGTAAFEDEVRDLALPVEFSLETMNSFIDWNRNVPVRGHPRRGRVRGLERRSRRERSRRPSSASRARSTSPAPSRRRSR